MLNGEIRVLVKGFEVWYRTCGRAGDAQEWRMRLIRDQDMPLSTGACATQLACANGFGRATTVSIAVPIGLHH